MKFIVFCVMLLMVTMACQTVEPEVITPEYQLPPPPERENLEYPENEEDLALLIVYYDGLVEDWEAWYEAVIKIIKGDEESVEEGDSSDIE